jgi:hypothetical protein
MLGGYVMKKLLLATAAVVAFTTPSYAFYTECTVQKDTDRVNRPGGGTEPRWASLEKGEKVAIRDTYRDWVFVTYFVDDRYEYGWVPRNSLGNCQAKDGTP